jgi:AAHS family 4-hydroxybenzoate transporter-like MFS transporter
MFLDGFDLMVTGVAIPKIAEFLHSKPSALDLAVSAGLIGTFIGSMGLGMLADRSGRKWMLVVSAFVFGFFTILVASVTAVWQLALFWFIAGIGLGGVIPNALAFGSEYAPSRLRKTFVATMFAGLPVGATLSGLVSAWFIPQFCWRSLFVLGGVSPIVITLLTTAFLPEPLEFLVGKGKDKVRIRNIVAKIAPALARDEKAEFYSAEKKLPEVPVRNLFTERRALITIPFWITLIAANWFGAVLVVWAPTMLHKSGATVVQYSLAFAGLNFGSVVLTILYSDPPRARGRLYALSSKADSRKSGC